MRTARDTKLDAYYKRFRAGENEPSLKQDSTFKIVIVIGGLFALGIGVPALGFWALFVR